MVSVYETAYPRLKSNSSIRELQDIYRPFLNITTFSVRFFKESTKPLWKTHRKALHNCRVICNKIGAYLENPMEN